MTCPRPEIPFRAEYRMPFYIMTSWQSLISAHISLNYSNEDEHLLSACLCQQAQCYAFPTNHLVQSPYQHYTLGPDNVPTLADGKTEAWTN